MLDQLPEIFGPHAPHVLVTFYPLLPRYGDLGKDENFRSLISDVCTLIELNPVPWDDAKFDRDRVFSMCRRRTLLEVFIKINELKCIEKNKSIWCCKSLESLYHLDKYDREGFTPFIIYIYRDGRDVALSFEKIMIGEKHIYHLAHRWRNDQLLALKHIRTLPAGRFVIIKYEDLIASPEKYMKRLCEMIGARYNPEVLDFYKSEESRKTASSGKMWENVTKPILRDNSGKYLKEMTGDELRIFESVAGDVLEELGYVKNYNGMPPLEFSDEQVKIFDEENRKLKQLAVANADPRDVQKRKQQNAFVESLKSKSAQPVTRNS